MTIPETVTVQDIARCHRLLEECIVRKLSQMQSVALLEKYAGISRVFSATGVHAERIGAS